MTEWRRSVWVVRGADKARLANYGGKWALMFDGNVIAIGTESDLRASGWEPWDGGSFPKKTDGAPMGENEGQRTGNMRVDEIKLNLQKVGVMVQMGKPEDAYGVVQSMKGKGLRQEDILSVLTVGQRHELEKFGSLCL